MVVWTAEPPATRWAGARQAGRTTGGGGGAAEGSRRLLMCHRRAGQQPGGQHPVERVGHEVRPLGCNALSQQLHASTAAQPQSILLLRLPGACHIVHRSHGVIVITGDFTSKPHKPCSRDHGPGCSYSDSLIAVQGNLTVHAVRHSRKDPIQHAVSYHQQALPARLYAGLDI